MYLDIVIDMSPFCVSLWIYLCSIMTVVHQQHNQKLYKEYLDLADYYDYYIIIIVSLLCIMCVTFGTIPTCVDYLAGTLADILLNIFVLSN